MAGPTIGRAAIRGDVSHEVETGRAMGFVASCPTLALLELSPLTPDVDAHVEVCAACQFALELVSSGDACERFEILLAARGDFELNPAGTELLARHLAACVDCRAVAATLAPEGDATGDLATLPRVDPAAYALGP